MLRKICHGRMSAGVNIESIRVMASMVFQLITSRKYGFTKRYEETRSPSMNRYVEMLTALLKS